mmetsp:Transcript_29842/g.53994  ORF Transcript_29842/g.53994 Transcript_29842/m.53994 type:complete len:89 (-) Transcript_29842:451-717(-)
MKKYLKGPNGRREGPFYGTCKLLHVLKSAALLLHWVVHVKHGDDDPSFQNAFVELSLHLASDCAKHLPSFGDAGEWLRFICQLNHAYR